MVCHRGEHHYNASGLDYVYLVGVEICQCQCGESMVGIPAVAKLHARIGWELINKPSLLSGQEIRFLRKNMGFTGKKLAEIMGVDKVTVSRWENNKEGIGKANDRLLRLAYASAKGLPDDQVKSLLLKEFPNISPVAASALPWRIILPLEGNACST
jgi:putative zinc finger/helix-turn-helix YgiT family protein